MLYRYEQRPNPMWGSRLAISTLTDDFQPDPNVSPYLLESRRQGLEDPRIFEHEGRLLVSYCSAYRQHLMELDGDFNVVRDQELSLPDLHKDCEKNWTYFSTGQDIYMVYSWQPTHRVYKLIDDGKRWSFTFVREQQVKFPDWRWGQIRGGTNPVLWGDRYWSFFHSSYFHPFLDLFDNRIYTAGYVVFEKEYPFKITHYSSEPILWPVFEDWGGLTGCAVVFPCGAERGPRGWNIGFGHHDYRCKILQPDDRELKLLERCVPNV